VVMDIDVAAATGIGPLPAGDITHEAREAVSR
jgi:hypothetical protein